MDNRLGLEGDKKIMRFAWKVAICSMVALWIISLTLPAAGAAKAATFTGTVSDAMCGAKHMMEGDPAGCLRACVRKGSNYALVVGDKVYTLDTQDKAALDTLDKLANQKASVKGQANGDTIEVSSVAPAK
jgi:hypothetical protein